MSGAERAILYRVALGTGFRASELRSLTVGSFTLDVDPPTVTIQAGYSKRRRRDVQPIRGDLADALAPWLRGKPADAPAFAMMPSKWNLAKMIRKDMATARKVWIDESGNNEAQRKDREQSEFLADADASGRVADFHALRHTFITRLVQSGASVKVAQELARHSTPVLTLGRYSHIGLHDTSAALDALPSLPPMPNAPQAQQLRKTGTDDLPHDPPTPPTPKPPRRHLDTSLDTICIAGRIPANPDGAENQPLAVAQTPANKGESVISSGNSSKPTAGVEPATYGLQNRCSAIELHRRKASTICFFGPYGKSLEDGDGRQGR